MGSEVEAQRDTAESTDKWRTHKAVSYNCMFEISVNKAVSTTVPTQFEMTRNIDNLQLDRLHIKLTSRFLQANFF